MQYIHFPGVKIIQELSMMIVIQQDKRIYVLISEYILFHQYTEFVCVKHYRHESAKTKKLMPDWFH